MPKSVIFRAKTDHICAPLANADFNVLLVSEIDPVATIREMSLFDTFLTPNWHISDKTDISDN